MKLIWFLAGVVAFALGFWVFLLFKYDSLETFIYETYKGFWKYP